MARTSKFIEYITDKEDKQFIKSNSIVMNNNRSLEDAIEHVVFNRSGNTINQYWKYWDGTLVISYSTYHSETVSNGWGGVFISAQTHGGFTYPVPFIERPNVQITFNPAAKDSLGGAMLIDNGSSNKSPTYRFWKGMSGISSGWADLLITGRWK